MLPFFIFCLLGAAAIHAPARKKSNVMGSAIGKANIYYSYAYRVVSFADPAMIAADCRHQSATLAA